MGNCLFADEKPIRIVKTDGKILEYKSPVRVFQVLSDFSGHAISDAVPATHSHGQHLQRTARLLSGHLYFLVPTAEEKPVRFADPEGSGGTGQVVRIKVVMTKKELREMVERGGGVCAEEMICKIKSGREISCRSEMDDEEEEEEGMEMRWKPVLESIPETQSEVAC